VKIKRRTVIWAAIWTVIVISVAIGQWLLVMHNPHLPGGPLSP
jgi:hypothetical protein